MRSVRLGAFALLAALLMSCGQANEPAAPSEPAATVAEETPAASTGDERVFCAEVGRRISPADCEDYVSLAQSATRGMAAFNAPNPMHRGETHTLQLAISYAPPETAESEAAQTDPSPASQLSPTPTETVEGLPGQTVEFEPLVGRFMRAELNGVGFEITPRSPASQEVAQDSVTTWTWEVIARQGGDRALTLTTVVEGCTANGECLPLRSTTQNYTVRVEVSRIDQVRDFLTGLPDWIKIASAIVGALAGLLLAFVSLRNAFRKTREN